MATLLDIKNLVANQMGADDATSANNQRDRLINRARRKFYSERKWSFLTKTATLTFTSQLADLPADYNEKYDPISIYTYSSNTKYHYDKVPYDNVSYYDTSQYVYGISKENDKIKINQTTVSTLSMDYTHLPLDRAVGTSENSTAEPTDDIEPIINLSIAYYWLSAERDTTKYQIFMDQYLNDLQNNIKADAANTGIRPINPYIRKYNIQQGYLGRK